MKALEGALDVGLVATGCFMLLALEFCVLDVVLAELAPVFWLRIVSTAQRPVSAIAVRRGEQSRQRGRAHLVAVHLGRRRRSGSSSLFSLGGSGLRLLGRCSLWVLRDGRGGRGVRAADERGVGGLGRLESRLEQLGV